MKRFLDDLEPDRWRLREPVWKFDSLVLDAGSLLTRRELDRLRDWDIRRLDVVPASAPAEAEPPPVELVLPVPPPEPEEPLPGVTDVVPTETLRELAATDLFAVASIEELERIDFALEESACLPNPALYLPDAVDLPDGYGPREAARATDDLAAFVEMIHRNAAVGEGFDIGRLKVLATLRVEEMERVGPALLRAVPGSRDGEYLARHAVEVATLAVAVAARLGMGKARRAEVCVAGLLHDIGMARVPHDAWMSAKRFQFDDYFPVFKHPILAVDHLARTLGNRLGGLVALGVYGHHERLDGSGYPKGRRGRGVSEYARILGPCDAFAAMANGRPHRRAHPPEDAFRFIAENAGSLFDLGVVAALAAALAEAGVLARDFAVAPVSGADRPVVIADPSPYNLWYICQLLRANHVPTHAARSEEDLAAAARELSPRVVVIDAAINARKGLDLIAALRSRDATRGTPLIYTSTSGDKGDVMQAIRLGVRDYLKKPYTFDFAVNRLSKFLAAPPDGV